VKAIGFVPNVPSKVSFPVGSTGLAGCTTVAVLLVFFLRRFSIYPSL
jgi:hypothetical protein